MNRFKEEQKDLDHLLYEEDSHNQSRQHHFNEVDEAEDDFIFKMTHDKEWNSNDNIENQFIKMNGPSIEFSQNYSQSSSMMYSHRQDDDSREYRRDAIPEKKYQQLLQEKKKEEIQFNRALDQELNETKKQLDWSELQIKKLNGMIRGYESKIQKQEQIIEGLEHQLGMKDEDIEKARKEREDLLRTQAQRDECFNEYKTESTKILAQLSEKDRENASLKKRIVSLEEEIYKLNQSLSIYQDSDHRLLNFNGGYTRQSYDSPLNSKRNDKELEKCKREKMALQIEMSTLKDKLQDREGRFKLVEEEHKKKISLKEKRIAELQQRMGEMKDEQLKSKTQNDIQMQKIQKLNASIGLKSKEINALSDKLVESDKRIKAFIEEGKKKDEKVKEVTLESLDKARQLAQKDKDLEEMKIKIEFDHQMIEDKDQEIEKLLAEKKTLSMQLDAMERQDKTDKLDKNEKEKLKREVEKTKKDYELLKKDFEMGQKELEKIKKDGEAVLKEKQDQVVSGKDWKKKFDQLSKKMIQMRNINSQLQENLQLKEQENQEQRDALDKAMKELTEIRKNSQAVPELKNKIILLESRIKNDQFREANQSYQSQTLYDRIQALEQKLEEKDKENKSLKTQLMTDHCSDEEFKELEFELAEKEELMEKEIEKRDKIIQKLRQDLQFKDHTLDFTHNILVQSEKAKIELEQEKKMLEQMVSQAEEDSFEGTREEIAQFYQHQIQELQLKLENEMRKQKDKEDEHRFELKQQKERIKELNQMLLSKDRKITPETMSQEDTVLLLIKITKRVTKSEAMLKLLSKNLDFREGWGRMEKQFRK